MYVRVLEVGVVFGFFFLGCEEVVYEKDEYMVIEDLFCVIVIYV